MNDMTEILVVDDEEAIREGCRRLLSGRGYGVVTAENGEKALDCLGKKPVDIVLLDLKMPVMSGEEVLERIRGRYPDIPVIIITGHGTVDTAVECMKKGAYDFITKPFQVDQFLITINRAADKRRLERKARQFEQENIRNLYDLNLEKSRLGTIINCMANGVMVTNLNMEIVLHNPALKRLMDIPEEIEYPAPLGKVVDDPSLISTLEKILKSEAGEDEFISQELCIGNRVLRAISAPAMVIDRNLFHRVAGTVTVIEDITIFKQLDRMKTDFVNMVAHELRSPLVSIRQLNHVLFEGLAGPLQVKQQDFVGRGLKKIDALLDLINDLLNVAKLEGERPVKKTAPLNLARLIEEACALLEPRAKEKGVALSFSCENMKPVEADPENIEKIFNNLLSNAINYSLDGGRVTVTAKGTGGQVEILVKDTGVGIPQEELPKIFDKFYRVKDPRTRDVTGTGLGLSIVRKVVESHRGTIEVDSVPDRGTTFRVLLPIANTSECVSG